MCTCLCALDDEDAPVSVVPALFHDDRGSHCYGNELFALWDGLGGAAAIWGCFDAPG